MKHIVNGGCKNVPECLRMHWYNSLYFMTKYGSFFAHVNASMLSCYVYVCAFSQERYRQIWPLDIKVGPMHEGHMCDTKFCTGRSGVFTPGTPVLAHP